MAESDDVERDARWEPAISAALTLLPEWAAVQSVRQRNLGPLFSPPEDLDDLIDSVWEHVKPTSDYLGRLGRFIERGLTAVEHMPGPLVEGDRLILRSTITAGLLHDLARDPSALSGLAPFLGPLGLAAARTEAGCHTQAVDSWLDWDRAGGAFRDPEPDRWRDYLPVRDA